MSAAVGGAPPAHGHSDSVNGRPPTIPAIPSVNGAVAVPDHLRKPSNAAPSGGAAGYTPNGGAQPGAQTKIQFGSLPTGNNNASPAVGTPHQNNANLSVNQLNPRVPSPSNSPSPIPQPASVSGGRPPSTFQGQGNGYQFGQMPGDPSDPSVSSTPSLCFFIAIKFKSDMDQGLARGVASLQFGPPQEHMRRGSAQSIHSDVGNPGLPTGPGRGGFGGPQGRGRGYNPAYNQQMPYSPNHTFRPQNNGRNMQPGYQGRGQQLSYSGSPAMGTRSPALVHAQPGTPNMGPVHMMQQVPGQNGGYYQGGPQHVNNHHPSSFSSSREPAKERGKPTRGRGRVNRGNGRGKASSRGGHEEGPFYSKDPASDHYRPDLAALHIAPAPPFLPDLSPESGNFEHFLTQRQGFGFPTQADPSIQMLYNQQYYGPGAMQGQYPPQYAMGPQQSPRPPYQQNVYAPNMQPGYSNQGAAPPSMSRQSSQMSGPDRPGSSIGQQPHTPAPSGPTHPTARTPSVSAPKPSYTIPPKKSAAITIKNTAGEVVSFGKPPPSPAASTPSLPPPSAPTPPSRTASAADNAHARGESISANKSADEAKKLMQEAIAKKIAEDEAREKQQKEAAEKAELDKEAAAAAARKAEEEKAEAEELEREAKEAKAREEAAAVEKAEEDNKKAEEDKAKAAAAPSKPDDDDEIDYDAIEREIAEQEAEEARRAEEYNRKKAADLEAKRKKEQDDAAAYEANMKEMERKAEEAELAREKEKAEVGSGDEASKKMFAELKANPFGTPASVESPAAHTPVESGSATPVSDVSMPAPIRAPGKRGKAAELTLDTKKPIEPPEPSATLKALQASKKLVDLSKVVYPADVASPNPALNANAPADRKFKYDKEFLLQFQSVFKEKPSLDWDSRIRDVMGEGDSARPAGSARTPSGMGNRSASSRGAPQMGSFGPMGSFGGPRPSLPAGTTSEQRFAASNAALRTGAMAANPFAQFGRPGQMAPPMGRTPSNNPLGPIPGSPRVGSTRGGSRAESKRGNKHGKQGFEENKSMPLTAGMNIGSLETSSTGWKARSLGQPAVAGPALGGDGLMEPDVVQRKVKAALNKMTPEKFDKIADQILEIAAQSKHESDGRTLRQVIQLTFEKATDEAHWAPMYAAFARRMLESMSPDIKDENIKDKNGSVVTGGNLFRKYLLNRCQEEFERGWKINLPGRKEGETEEAALLSDEYYVAAAAKRRGLGLVKFIGELFKLSMLTERIMHECVKKLVDYEGTPDEAEVESLTSLLRTIGRQLDSSESKAQGRMDLYFERINQIIAIPDLPSRLRFMLMDIVDLRSKGWVSKEDDKGPKTIQAIHEEAERRAREDELKRLASQGNRGGGGRMPMGRGDARSFSQYGQVPPPDNSNRVGTDDLRRLGNRNARNPSSTGPGSLGPSSLLGGRTNSGRRGLGPGGLLNRGDDSNSSSRTGTPPAGKDKEKKDDSSTNAFR
ncbi:translation initiation factor 4G [Exophiala aquamarina CBS 119918]|uniref:Translation initiation factor 4G n=1 Tax=Exophiala aquamarina CBS 119918 TaxID=1182545 RepID=A0A072P2V9_9EURO|nr:translation initiation factor 4G [Exophiala aquamarina CBS 119918]KEF54176.1 translation initiation factor 4G [Exophiala aquamarina CBS 119918]